MTRVADRYYGDDKRSPEAEFALDVGRRRDRLVLGIVADY